MRQQPATGAMSFTPVALESRLNFYEILIGVDAWNGPSPNQFAGMGIAIGDYNNDGWLDYYRTDNGPGPLSTNNGDGTFSTVDFGDEIAPNDGWGAAFIDITNGGKLSLFRAGTRNSLFPGSSTGLFEINFAAALGFSGFINDLAPNDLAHGLAVADYDNDGDMDVVTNRGLYRNSYYRTGSVSTSGSKWINVVLENPGSMNHRGIGAKLRLKANSGTMQTREIHAGSSHGSTNSFVQHFGLESVRSIDSLVIQWPSGCKQVLLRNQITPGAANTVQKGDCVSGHTISGVVTDSQTGQGLPGVTVPLYNFGSNTDLIAATGTNNEGEYIFAGVPQGSYIIAPWKFGVTFDKRTSRILGLMDGFPTLDDQSAYFKTEDTGNVYTLSGVVTTSNGQALGGVTVTLLDSNTRSIVIDSFVTNPTGFYQLEVPQALGVYYMTATRVGNAIPAPASVMFLPGNSVFENQVINLGATIQ